MRDLLAGLRVLDAGSFIAGPYAAMVLGDWGADVVKAEPLAGDPARAVGEAAAPGLSTTFIAANRGKRSVALDLEGDAGRARLRRLAQASDVVIHNASPARAARWGLDHASLAARCPAIVTCAVSAFGPVGPRAGRPGLDPTIQAMSGLAALTGDPDGPPTRCGAPVVDIAAGMTAAAAILAALVGRGRDGHGAEVAVSLFDTALALQGAQVPLRSLRHEELPRRGNGSYALVGDQFAGTDGFIAFVVWDDERWERVCRILGRGDLARAPRFATHELRHRGLDELRAELAGAVAARSVLALERELLDAGVPCGVTAALGAVLADPDVAATAATYREPRVGGDGVTMVAGPVRFNGARVRAGAAPPRLGEHTAAVLAELDAFG